MKYRRYKEYYFHPRIFILFPLMTFVCIVMDITMLYKSILQWLMRGKMSGLREGVLSLLCRMIPNDLGDNADVFFAVWGVAIALAIFIIEISGSYHCGISLKRITRWQWGNQICLGAIEYLLLGPLMYLSNNVSWKITSFWCVIVAFAGMGYMLVFFQCFMHIDIIQELLIDRTEQMLCSWKRKGQRVTHSKIDMLPVADMLEHIDYEQADEIQVMLDTL